MSRSQRRLAPLPLPADTDANWTPADIAKRWQCHPRTVRRLADEGKLAGFRVRDLWRFHLAAIVAYELAHSTAPIPEPAASCSTARPLRRSPRAAELEYVEPSLPGPWPWIPPAH